MPLIGTLRALCILLFAALAGAGQAQALGCSGTVAPISVDPASAADLQQEGHSTLEVTCSDFPSPTSVYFCASVGEGSRGTDESGNRRLSDSLTSPTYQLQIGSVTIPVDVQTAVDAYSIVQESATFSMDVSAVVDWALAGPAGMLTSNFGDGEFSLHYGSTASCDEGIMSVTGFAVSATLEDGCKVSADPLDFGTIPVGFTADVEKSTAITVTCTGQTAYAVTLSKGENFDETNGLRAMANGSSKLSYKLVTQDGDPWISQSGTGTGEGQSIAVYGVVPSGQTGLLSGSYNDSVIVTVEY